MNEDRTLEFALYTFITAILMEIFTCVVAIIRGDMMVASIVSVTFALTIFLFILFLKERK